MSGSAKETTCWRGRLADAAKRISRRRSETFQAAAEVARERSPDERSEIRDRPIRAQIYPLILRAAPRISLRFIRLRSPQVAWRKAMLAPSRSASWRSQLRC